MTGKRTWKRRDFLRTSGVVAGGSAVAGCLGDDSDENDDESDDTDATGNGDEENETEDTDAGDDAGDADDITDSEGTESDDTENDGSEEDDSSEEDDDSEEEDEEDEEPAVTVSMPPVGEVAFESVPERWAANNGSWADMGIALGQEPPEALYLAHRYHTQYYDDIPGVSVDAATIDSLWDTGELSPAEFFELSEDVDVFVMDPNRLTGQSDNMTGDEIERIESMGTPFFGNSIFSRDYGWHDDYQYLTLYEAFEKLSQVFDETHRYAAFESLHAEFQSRLDEVVPPKGNRPEVAILWPLRDGEFAPYVIDEGTSFKQWRDLGVRDAFVEAGMADSFTATSRIGYETLLEVDPDVLLLRGNEHRSAAEFDDTVVSRMKSHDVASSLTAVQNDNVYRGGPFYQGPITNLVLTERAARQLYDVDRELFDRQRVSDIVTGRF